MSQEKESTFEYPASVVFKRVEDQKRLHAELEQVKKERDEYQWALNRINSFVDPGSADSADAMVMIIEERDELRHELKMLQSGYLRHKQKTDIALEALKFYAEILSQPTWAKLVVDGGAKAREAIIKSEGTK